VFKERRGPEDTGRGIGEEGHAAEDGKEMGDGREVEKASFVGGKVELRSVLADIFFFLTGRMEALSCS